MLSFIRLKKFFCLQNTSLSFLHGCGMCFNQYSCICGVSNTVLRCFLLCFTYHMVFQYFKGTLWLSATCNFFTYHLTLQNFQGIHV
uniref:Uncharacterized protein n=1 Tax=Arundo donax TaxID=35708 RepID=A0A0A9FXM0_ARUDO